MASSGGVARPLRADARRNREALLLAAAETFRVRGPDVSMLEIADAAGVGVGTLYRHFPQREALVLAVFRQGLEALCDEVVRLLADHPADEALELGLRRVVEHISANQALKLIITRIPAGPPVDRIPPQFAEANVMLTGAVSQLLDAAARRRLIGTGGGADAGDLLRTVSALCRVDVRPDEAARIIHLLVDGLRYRA
jgi:AcrR family transcriptional regulator